MVRSRVWEQHWTTTSAYKNITSRYLRWGIVSVRNNYLIKTNLLVLNFDVFFYYVVTMKPKERTGIQISFMYAILNQAFFENTRKIF